jgi:uncharacterized membrane protein
VFAVYLAMSAGLLLIDLLLVCFCLKAFGTRGRKCFGFLNYFVKHSYLAWSGLALYVGLFITNIPQYDMTMFMAIMIHFPGMIIFEIIMRRCFYDKYARYLSAVQSGTYDLIDKERESLQNSIRLQVFLAYGIQLAVTLISVAFVNALSICERGENNFAEEFTILALGMFFVLCMYDTIIILYYFSGYKEAGIITTVFALTVVIGMFVCYKLGTEYSLLPLPMGGVIGWIVSSLILRSKLKNINAFILCK